MAVQLGVYFSRWQLTPSWISKNNFHFFTKWSINVKVGENVAILAKITYMTSKVPKYWNPRWRTPPYWILKNCCHFFTISKSSVKFSGNVAIWAKITSMTSTVPNNWKPRWRTAPSWIWKNGCQFLTNWRISVKFDIDVAIDANIYDIRSDQVLKFNMADAAILTFEKLLLFLYHSTNQRQIWYKCWDWS